MSQIVYYFNHMIRPPGPLFSVGRCEVAVLCQTIDHFRNKIHRIIVDRRPQMLKSHRRLELSIGTEIAPAVSIIFKIKHEWMKKINFISIIPTYAKRFKVNVNKKYYLRFFLNCLPNHFKVVTDFYKIGWINKKIFLLIYTSRICAFRKIKIHKRL